MSTQSDVDILNEEFKHYVNCAKPLVSKLKTVSERKLASAWLIKLKNEDNSQAAHMRNGYMKILFYCLAQHRLIEPFSKPPVQGVPLQDFPPGVRTDEIIQSLAETDEAKRKADGGDEEKLPYTIEVSSNKKQYAAVQEIPNFGVHCYFALSSEPLPHWESIKDIMYESSHEDIKTPISFIGPPLNRHESFKYKEPMEKHSHGLYGVEVHRVVVDVLEGQPQAQTSQSVLTAVRKSHVTTRIPMTQNFRAIWRQMYK